MHNVDLSDYEPGDYPEDQLLDEKCGACGKPATWVDHNEPVCNKHRAGDVYGVSISDFI